MATVDSKPHKQNDDVEHCDDRLFLATGHVPSLTQENSIDKPGKCENCIQQQQQQQQKTEMRGSRQNSEEQSVGDADKTSTDGRKTVLNVNINIQPFVRPDSVCGSRDRHQSAGRICRSSIVDDLLFEIYDRWNSNSRRYSYDSDTTYTGYSSTSDAFFGRSDSIQSAFDEKQSACYQRKYLQNKDISELRHICSELKHRVSKNSARLVRQLKNRDRHIVKANRSCDIITAILQASSLKRRIDSKIRFSIEPLPGEEAFNQWRDAMKAVARLPLGIPPEFRKKVWLALADNHIKNLKIDWEQTKRLAFNDRSNPDDNRLGVQIVKDLHRTGCSGFSGTDNEEDRAVLKRMLLAYARWNKKVGYCQGFNVLAALILDVMERKEDDALKVMIYLVDYVLPESYFANNLRALSVDMAVFRDLLHMQLPKLSNHLDHLQTAARDDKTGASYEPPLTNVFTMQWFLTLFATCLPKSTALRVWDSVLLEGSEILLRTAVALWGKLQKHIKLVQSADEFYTVMGTLSHKMLNCNMIEPDSLIKMVYAMGPLPMPQLTELREKYTYNITPFTAAMNTDQHTHVCSDDDDFDDDEFVENINCFGGIFPPQQTPSPRSVGEMDKIRSGSSFDISKASPGAYAAHPEELGPLASMYAERMSLDINQLKQQYKKLRQRQKQAHIILAAASARHYSFKPSTPSSKEQYEIKHQAMVTQVQSPVAVNHLFIGRQQTVGGKRNATVTDVTNIMHFYPEVTSSLKKEQQKAHLQQYRRTKQSGSTENEEVPLPTYSKVARSQSIDSSVSGTSTLKSSQNSGSSSDISTCGAESEYLHSDTESIMSEKEKTDNEDLIIFDCKTEDEEEDKTEQEGSSEKDSNSDDVVQDKLHSDIDAHPACVLESSNPSKSTDSDENLFVENFKAKDSACEKLHDFISNKSNSSQSEINQCAQQSAKLLKNTVSRLVSHQECETPISEVTYNNIRPLQMPSGTASAVTSVQSAPFDNNNLKGTVQPVKLFNPFPGQHVNSRKLKNGMKLGLYSAQDIPNVKTGISKLDIGHNLGKSQANSTCIQRQFLARN